MLCVKEEVKSSAPVPLEIERKYLVQMPDLEALITLHGAEVTNILQTYLRSDIEGEGTRVRQRGNAGAYVYSVTKKRTLSNLVRTEEEKQISAAAYLELMMTADTALHQIRKDRYCFDYKSICFELDVYPFWTDKAIMEVELDSETQAVDLPDFIAVIKEVTDDPAYRNHSIAKTIPV